MSNIQKVPRLSAEATPRIWTSTVWSVVTNTDLTEGRGAQYVLGYFRDRELAEKHAKTKGVMGCDAEVRNMGHQILIEIHDKGSYYGPFLLSMDEVVHNENTHREAIRQRALAKLTDEEKEVLGHK